LDFSKLKKETVELRITALWALSEAALGGILHIFKIPFAGILLSGSAVVFICLLARLAENPASILKATTIVILIKFTMAPHSPLTAYFSVFSQGLLGFMLFSLSNSPFLNSLALGILAVLFSGFQRLIVITIIFGNRFWEALDDFVQTIMQKFFTLSPGSFDFSISLVIILVYLLIHLTAGIIIGIAAYKFPGWIKNFSAEFNMSDIILTKVIEKKKTKRKWYVNKVIKTMIVFFVIAAILTLVFPADDGNLFINVLYMILRAVVIVIIWVYFLAPFVRKFLSLVLKRKQEVYGQKLDEIFNLLPLLKHIVSYSWRDTKSYKNIKRIKEFLLRVITISLTIELNRTNQ
jgi:hypothetical protein